MVYVFDIDGVLCYEDDPDVSKREPIEHHIRAVNKLVDAGHDVDIFTSRGMKSTNNNPAASDLKYRELTESQLASWGVKYRNLYFGKPNANFYIDNNNLTMEFFFRGAE